jgi:hypothetical protein
MKFSVSKHAHEEMIRRRVTPDELNSLMTNPDQINDAEDKLLCYQSQQIIKGKKYLLRAIVNESSSAPHVVTVYRTSKIKKYWTK